MATWQLVIGTVGFGACLVALCAWAMLAAARGLEDDDADPGATAVSAQGQARGPVAIDSGWGDAGHLRAMRAEERRRELRERVQATTKARGPARIVRGPFHTA